MTPNSQGKGTHTQCSGILSTHNFLHACSLLISWHIPSCYNYYFKDKLTNAQSQQLRNAQSGFECKALGFPEPLSVLYITLPTHSPRHSIQLSTHWVTPYTLWCRAESTAPAPTIQLGQLGTSFYLLLSLQRGWPAGQPKVLSVLSSSPVPFLSEVTTILKTCVRTSILMSVCT